MTEYAYFPGCSLEKMAINYHQSAMETARKLGVTLKELDDWNCCGATTYSHVDELLAHTLSARNLAMAEQANLDLVVPCSACYKNSYFTNKYLKEDADLADHVNYALEEDDLSFTGKAKVKHLMEMMVEDVGLDVIKDKVETPLEGLRVAPYYGCQILRPRKNGEDVENPDFFENLLSAIGAEPVDYALKTYCCGGSLILTSREAALNMCRNLLDNAADRGAVMIATVCPMCQINLECYQALVNQEFGTDFKMPIVYFTQLVGLALGIKPKKLGIGMELISAASLKPYAA
jgi:heterodisulfide reductase subunit B